MWATRKRLGVELSPSQSTAPVSSYSTRVLLAGRATDGFQAAHEPQMSPRTTRTLPDIQPILLKPRRDPFDDPAWLFEPKFDGYRGLLYVTRKGCWFRSK